MSIINVAAILVAVLCAAHGAPLDDATPLATEDYRLSLDIMPVNYNIILKPYLLETDGAKRFTFDGQATIEILPGVATKNIVMHSKNLKYTMREYWPKDNTAGKINLTAVEPNAITDKITYELATPLEANKPYMLHFVYTGTMDDDMHGFYRSSYVDKDNNTKWIGSTQFESNHARRAFPSFDEPKFKATYDLSITRHKSWNTFANTRINHTVPEATDYETDVYVTLPRMSTYLVAFIVSEFQQRKTDNGNFGVIARPEPAYQAQTEYSFDVGQKILAELDNYTGIPYYGMGVDKMHMAAIPDFSAGAMENWGLLTYRERALLYEEGSTTLSAKQSIAAVIAHEQVHMWFGDLVTCDWWSYTWLNEGFARYFQYHGTAMVEKNWELEKQFVVDQIQSVMGMDSTNGTNPMTNEDTNTPADISRMFNSISYNKGASFIRMTKHVMGEENFRKSLQEYLQTYRSKTAVPDNLFDIWGNDTYWPSEFKSYADSFFRSFTEMVGYPVVHIKVADDRKNFHISQKRFLLKENDGSDASLLYTVPITYTTNKEKDFTTTKPKLFLNATSSESAINLNAEIDWIIVNIQETGYYRVNYDETSWHKIHHALYENNWGGIHELNRAQAVDDLFNLARAGVIKYELALAVLEYLETETNYLPWTSAFNGYSYLAIRLGTDTNHFGIHIRQLMEKAYKHLGFEENTADSALDIYNRAKILSWSCKYGNTDCISKAKNHFQKLKDTPVPVNIRSAVYCTAMREGNEADFDMLFNKYKNETVATEQTLILTTLGCVKNTKLVEKYFNIIMSDDVRRQDKSSALSGLYSDNNENVSPVFKLVTDHFEHVADSMGGYSAVASAISGLASRFTEESQEKDLKEFNAKNRDKFGSSASTLDAAEKTVAENLLWSKNNLGVFKQYLSKRVGGGAASIKIFTSLTLVLVAIAAMLLH